MKAKFKKLVIFGLGIIIGGQVVLMQPKPEIKVHCFKYTTETLSMMHRVKCP